MLENTRAPWDVWQVGQLNRYQRSGLFHPFTCGKRDPDWHGEGILIATESGWICPEDRCDYTLEWAWSFMMDRHWLDAVIKR